MLMFYKIKPCKHTHLRISFFLVRPEFYVPTQMLLLTMTCEEKAENWVRGINSNFIYLYYTYLYLNVFLALLILRRSKNRSSSKWKEVPKCHELDSAALGLGSPDSGSRNFALRAPNSAAGAAGVVFCSHMQPLHAWGIWIGRGVMKLKSLWMSKRNVEAERDYLCTFVCMHTHPVLYFKSLWAIGSECFCVSVSCSVWYLLVQGWVILCFGKYLCKGCST